jgi:hypothetical protein
MQSAAEIKAENEICARTMVSLRKQAEVMGWSLDQALAEVIPSTRKRLVAYLERLETHWPEGGTRLTHSAERNW